MALTRASCCQNFVHADQINRRDDTYMLRIPKLHGHSTCLTTGTCLLICLTRRPLLIVLVLVSHSPPPARPSPSRPPTRTLEEDEDEEEEEEEEKDEEEDEDGVGEVLIMLVRRAS